MRTHLVTGAAGFVGSHLTRALLDRGDRVIAVDDLSGGWIENVPDEAEFHQLDLAEDPIDDLFPVDYVWHLAAYAAEGLSHWVRAFNYRNNLIASSRLITAAVQHEVDHFYFTSSMAVYGSQIPPFTERMRPAPEDPYGIAKYAVEQDLAVAGRVHGLDWTVFRPHNVYGPGQNIGDPYRNVVGIFMRQGLAGLPVTVFGDGSQTRAFSHISDIITPMVAALDRNTNRLTYNIGGEQVVQVGDLAARIAGMFDVPVDFLPPRVEVKHAHCDHSLAREHLGFDPQVPLDVGLEGMAEWVRTAGVRWSTPPELEHTRDLPSFWQHPRETRAHVASGVR